MYFGKLSIKNFLVIGEAEVDLHNCGLTLIEGRNEDDESANSNGAGKSSLVDALCWCLYGVTGRGVSGDAVINKKAKKECVVGVEVWTESLNCYYIERGRKSKRLGNNLIVQHVIVDGNDVGSGCELTKTTVADTQVLVNDLLGCSYEIFTSSIYAVQEKMPDLPALTDKNLKTLIEEAAGIDKLQRASEIAHTKHQDCVRLTTETQGKIENLTSELSNNKKLLDDVVYERETHIRNATIERAQQLRYKDLLESELKKASALPVEAVKAIEKKKAEIQAKIDEYSFIEAKGAEKQRLAMSAQSHCVMTKKEIEKEKEKIADLNKEINNLEAKIGTHCSECGKVYQAEDLETAKKAIETQIANKTKEVLKQIEDFKNQVAEAKVLAKDAEDFKKSMPNATELMSAMNELNERLKKNQDVQFQIDTQKRELQNLKKTIEATEEVTVKGETPYNKTIKTLEESIAKLEKDKKERESEHEKYAEQQKIAEAVDELYSRKGIRAHILDTVTPFLNERTAFYLNTLSDGEITATWQTLTKTAKGDFKEKFSIDVQSVKGANCFAGLSGGEKRKVRVATSMALQDLVASRAKKPIDLYIADEVDHALDASGLERMMSILEEKAKQFGTALVISHNSLRDWIDNSIVVTKRDGISTVSREE
jgi:DNA repair exonuclease SbcCD ATPase subunit